MRGALLLVAVVACAKVDPEPEFPPPSFQILDDGNFGLTVVGPEYEMRFAGGGLDAMHFPDQLRITNSSSPNILGDSASCNAEQLVGMAMFPALITSPDTDATIVPNVEGEQERNSISVFAPGPHIVKIGVRYTLDYLCPMQQRFDGDAVFTFFPNGRIVREDINVRPTTMPLAGGTNEPCGCGNTGGMGTRLVFTSFWAFEDGGVTATRAGEVTPMQGTPLQGPFDGTCAIYPQHAIGVSYAGGIDRLVNNMSNVAHVRDLVNEEALEPTLEDGLPYNGFSAIQIVTGDGLTATDCDTILEGLSEPGVEVDGQALAQAGPDGIYFNDVPHEDSFDIRVIRDSEPLPPGWALMTRIPSGSAKITRFPAPSDPNRPIARVQREFGDRFIFVFEEGLGAGATITIEPQ